MTTEPNVSIIVCTYNRCERLEKGLQGVLSQRLDPGLRPELIVVDNNSTDRTPAVVKEIAARAPWPIRYVFEGEPGVCLARNRGIAESRSRVLCFTDDDVIPHETWLSSMVRAFDQHRADVLCGPIRPLWQSPPSAWAIQLGSGPLALADYGDKPFVITSIKHLFLGANMAFRKEVFDQLGGFRLDLGISPTKCLRAEDTELFERVLAAGKRVVYEPAASVSHWVPNERLTRRYFRRWKYWSGYATSVYHGPESVTWLPGIGMPAWALREALDTGWRTLGCYLRRQWLEGFELELHFWEQIGYARGLGQPRRERQEAGQRRMTAE